MAVAASMLSAVYYGPYGRMIEEGRGGWAWWWAVVIGVVALAVVAAGAIVAWLIVRSSRGQGSQGAAPAGDGTRRAREILAERYAKGELTTEEYQERSQALG